MAGVSADEFEKALDAARGGGASTAPKPGTDAAGAAFERALDDARSGKTATAAAADTAATRAGEKAAKGSMLDNLVDSFTQGLTFGWGDELTAVEAAALGRTPEGGWFDYGKSFGDRYARALEAERAQNKAFAKAHPVASTVAEIGGNVASTAAALGSAGGAAAKSIPQAMAKAAGAGAIEGGIYGAGTAEGDWLDRVIGAGEGALVGAGTAGLLQGALQGGGRALRRVVAGQQAKRTKDSVLGVAKRVYKFLNERDPTLTGLRQMDFDLAQKFSKMGYAAEHYPRSRKALQMIEMAARRGDDINYVQLDSLRQYAKRAAESTDPSERMFGRVIKDHIDDLFERNLPQMGRVRDMYRRAKNYERVEGAIKAAVERANTGGVFTGGNIENTLRQEFRRLVKTSKTFSPDEVAELLAFANGEGPVNIGKAISGFAPQRSAVAMTGHAANMANAFSGSPYAMAQTAATAGLGGFKAGFDKARMMRARGLLDVMLGNPRPEDPFNLIARLAARSTAKETAGSEPARNAIGTGLMSTILP